jgi:hypothetical protein
MMMWRAEALHRVLRSLLGLCLLLAPAQTASAQPQACQGQSAPQTAFAYETITIGATAVPLTALVYAPMGTLGPSRAWVTVEDNPVRITLDGTTPTATAGHQLTVGQELTLCGHATIVVFQAIRTGSADGTLHVTYWK